MSQRSGDDADRFRIRLGAPKQRGDAFVSKVLRQATKAANATGGKRGKAPGSRLGRGHVAARFTGQSLSASSRRAMVKMRLVYLKQAGVRSTITAEGSAAPARNITCGVKSSCSATHSAWSRRCSSGGGA